MARTFLIGDPDIGWGYSCDDCGLESVALGWDPLDANHAADSHECEEPA